MYVHTFYIPLSDYHTQSPPPSINWHTYTFSFCPPFYSGLHSASPPNPSTYLCLEETITHLWPDVLTTVSAPHWSKLLTNQSFHRVSILGSSNNSTGDNRVFHCELPGRVRRERSKGHHPLSVGPKWVNPQAPCDDMEILDCNGNPP